MSLFTKLEPDVGGRFLGVPDEYQRFVARNGLMGLAKVHGARLDLLAVFNPTGTSGVFRAFIDQAKLEFSTICVWEIFNPILHDALLRYGFTSEIEIAFDGVPLHGLRWDRTP